VVVKSKKHGDLLDNLKETFDNVRMYKMMLNPKTCVLGVSSSKLLGYMISAQGIDANPKKVEVIEQLQPPRTQREIQKMAGMMVARVDNKTCDSLDRSYQS
jgi:Trp operon repressor